MTWTRETTAAGVLTFLSLLSTLALGLYARAGGRGRSDISGWGSRIQAGRRGALALLAWRFWGLAVISTVAGVTSVLALSLQHGDKDRCFLLSVGEFERQASSPCIGMETKALLVCQHEGNF